MKQKCLLSGNLEGMRTVKNLPKGFKLENFVYQTAVFQIITTQNYKVLDKFSKLNFVYSSFVPPFFKSFLFIAALHDN